jgi:uncharacterized protein
MNAPITPADRIADAALVALCALTALAVLLFFALVGFVSPAAAQDRTSCTGIDMIAEMERDDPTALAAIRGEASQTINGTGLLWRIDKDGIAPSWLYGTMHVTDPRVLDLPEGVQAAFDAADTLVIEATEILDQQAMAGALLSKPEYTMFTDDTTLRSLIAAEDLPMVEAELARRGMPLAALNRMKPWIVAALVAMPQCELDAKAAGAPILDQKLAEDALAAGKTLEGLETVDDQFGAMASLPMQLHVDGLVATLALGERVDDIMETMLAIYLDGETGLFWPFFRAALPDAAGANGTGYADFEAVMVTTRNRNMAQNAEPLLEAGNAFIAVGALHLPGEEGLVELLRQRGYSVTSANTNP